MPRARLFTDFMLKSLCRWLRILGIACGHAEEFKLMDDEELIKHAMRNKQILLTRDEELWRKAGDYVRCLLVPSLRVEQQVAFVAKELKLRLKPLPSTTLCPKCGSQLHEVKHKREIKHLVFPRVYARHREFWRCANKVCNAVYWKGSHWPNIKKQDKLIRRLAAKLC